MDALMVRNIVNKSRSFIFRFNCRGFAVEALDFDENSLISGSDKKNYKKTRASRNMKTISLSDRQEEACLKLILHQHSEKQISVDGNNLFNRLWSRHLPLEKHESKHLYFSKASDIAFKQGLHLESFSDSMKHQFLETNERKLIKAVKKREQMWKRIEYNTYMGLLYMSSWMVPNYASLLFVLSDLVKNDPEFIPKHVFSFGSGVGCDIWATQAIWPQKVHEYFCVDSSSEMIELADQLLHFGDMNLDPLVENVYFRQFLPAGNERKYNLVISSFSLLELPSAKQRIQTIDNLWQKTVDYLLIVEAGTNAGYNAVMEARDYVLKCSEDEELESVYVAAPCVHEKPCPRFNDGTKTPCNFEIGYNPLALTGKESKQKFRFSYVLIKKGKRSENTWPRIVRPVKNRHKHTVCEACCSSGNLKSVIITKGSHKYDLYKSSRYLNWGDFIPVSNL